MMQYREVSVALTSAFAYVRLHSPLPPPLCTAMSTSNPCYYWINQNTRTLKHFILPECELEVILVVSLT